MLLSPVVDAAVLLPRARTRDRKSVHGPAGEGIPAGSVDQIRLQNLGGAAAQLLLQLLHKGHAPAVFFTELTNKPLVQPL